jgi:hypothetical protein
LWTRAPESAIQAALYADARKRQSMNSQQKNFSVYTGNTGYFKQTGLFAPRIPRERL